jgi:hypothetical protein
VPVPAGHRAAEAPELLADRPGPEVLEVRDLNSVGERTRITLGRHGIGDFLVETLHHHLLRPRRHMAAPATRDWWHQDLDFVEGTMTTNPVGGTEHEQEVDLPLLRLHRPRHEDCTATYGVGLESGESATFGFSVAGVGIGGGLDMTVTATDIYTATQDTGCIEVVTRARVQSAEIELALNGVVVDRHPAALVVEAHPGNVDPRPLGGELDRCGFSYEIAEGLPGHLSRDLRGPHDPDDELDLEFGRKTTGSFDVDVQLPDTTVKFKLSLERTTKTTTKITTALLHGARYTTYEPGIDETIERCWTTD